MHASFVSSAVAAFPAILAAGWALAQPPRLMQPPDLSGRVPETSIPLQMPSESAGRWLLEPGDRVWGLEIAGILAERGVDEIRVERAGQPDAILTVVPETLWLLEGRAVSPAVIPLGSEVHAIFDLDGNRRIAQRVEALPPGPAGERNGSGPPPPVSSEIPGLRIDEDLPGLQIGVPGEGPAR